jgi:hypothetical protein
LTHYVLRQLDFHKLHSRTAVSNKPTYVSPCVLYNYLIRESLNCLSSLLGYFVPNPTNLANLEFILTSEQCCVNCFRNLSELIYYVEQC